MIQKAIVTAPLTALGLRFSDDPLTALAFCGVGLLVFLGWVVIEAVRLSAWPAATAYGRALKRKINTFWRN